MRYLRLLGKIALVGVVLAILGMIFVYWRSNQLLAQRILVDEPALTIPSDAESIARGEHLATTRGCRECHGKDLGGNILVESFPVGRIAGPNLTRGKGGIGNPDSIKLERAIRHGIGTDGHLLIYMPATDFSGLSDADTAALMAYIASRPPVSDPPSRPRA